MVGRVALSVVIAVACVGRVSAADPRVDRAAAALDELRYREAVRGLDEAWRAGGHGPAELRRIFALAGTAAGSTGDAAAAQAWFSRWLYLEPAARLPAGSSPKLAVLLEAARRELAGRALAAHAARRGERVAVTIDDDPLALVAAVRAGAVQRPIGAGALELATSGPVALVDRYGNVLVELAVAPARDAAQDGGATARDGASAKDGAGAGDGVPRQVAGPAWYARWPLWAVVAAGGAVVGGFAWNAAANADARLTELVKDSDSHEYSEARTEEDRRSRAQWTARISLGAAVASATFAVVCYVRGRAVRTTIAPTGDGASVMWSLRY